MENINYDSIEIKRAVRGLKVIKIVLGMFDIYHCPIIPENDAYLWVMQDDIGMHLEIQQIDGEIILKIEEIEVTDKGQGLGSLVLFIITTCMGVSKTKVGLWTVPGNEVSEIWYKKLGFEQIRVLEHNNHKWHEYQYDINNEYYENKLDVDILALVVEAIHETLRILIIEEVATISKELKERDK